MKVETVIACPECYSSLSRTVVGVMCVSCKREYVVKGDTFFFINPPDNVVLTRSSMEFRAEKWSEWRRENHNYFSSVLKNVSRASLLADVGCGSVQFRDIFFSFSGYVGLDFYPFDGVSIVADFSKKLPLTSKSFDVVTLSNVLEHMSEPALLLSECERILKPGGTVVGTVPFLIPVHQAPYDFYRYTNFGLEYLLKKSGFTNIVVTPLTRPANVFKEIEHSFFSSYFNEEFKGGHRKKMHRLFMRVFRKLLKLMHKIMDRHMNALTPLSEYALGYGFTCQVPASPLKKK